ncbi:MAG: ribonuclease E/G [Gammaproteobacteria bacterium]|nr:ribonuclease E/G [Gammaproteobacteria bacterium]
MKFYTEPQPLFVHYKAEAQISSIYQRQIRLSSGGSLAIDQTEALVAIDINSAKATKGGDIEETALQTNLEAADEIAKQLRLRDIGGLIVIDFIDMSQHQNQRLVEERLRQAVNHDRAKIQLGKISRFGLLEMSRQRLRSAFAETNKAVCPHCQGQGIERSIPSISLTILRAIEEQMERDGTTQVRAHVPIEVAAYLLNEQRAAIEAIEVRQKNTSTHHPACSLEQSKF